MSQWQCETPVVLLLFKRAEATAKVFEVVRQVKPNKLLVVADGPRPDRPGEAEKCAATRAIIDRVDWDCEVLTNYSDVNLGCKARVSSGLNWVFSLVEEAIIIEDDCVPDVSFFRYCEELLERYRDDIQIMSVTGENTHGYRRTDASYYFSYYSFYWGWATWRRAWELFDGKMELWAGLRQTNWLKNLLQDPDATEYWTKIFDQTFDGFNSWGWAWTFSCFVNQGLCAIANENLISNIGFGPDAAHHTWSVDELGDLPIEPVQFPLQHPDKIFRDLEADIVIDKVRFSGRSTFRSLRNQGIKQLNKQSHQKALDFFEQSLALRPDLIGLNYGRAMCLARMNQLEKAIASLEQLLIIAPTHTKAQSLLKELQGNGANDSNLLKQDLELEDLMASTAKVNAYELLQQASQPSGSESNPVSEPVVVPANKPRSKTTIFAIPKAFHGHIGIIQRNAIASWTKLEPRPEIILFGEDEGTAEVAQELSIRHVPKIRCNEFGTPMLDDIFAQAQQLATNDVVTYVNADIILLQDFVEALKQVSQQYDEFMMIGRRWDIDITTPWDFEAANWSEQLTQLILKAGILHNVTGKDYFSFPKNLFAKIPEFAVGRAKWDNWMIHEAISRKYHVVDATQGVMAIHQNHDYRHLKGGKLESSRGKEAIQNKLAGGTNFSGTIADATKQFIPASPAKTPRVSVIISTYNQESTLRAAIDSVLSQTYEDYEIIIIDYGSTDNSKNIAQSYGDRLNYTTQGHQNVLNARNYGLELARGELVAFLDADSSFLPNKLKEQLACFDRRGSLEIVNSGWQIVDSEGNAIAETQPWKDFPTLEPEEMHVWKLWKLWRKFPMSAVMFRRTHLKANDGFNTQLHPDVAAVDLMLRLAAKGCLGTWLRQPTCCYGQDQLQTAESLEKIASSFNLLLDNFFKQDFTTDWMQILQSQAYYNTLVFSAWLMHQSEYFDQRDQYLNKSLQYTAYAAEETAKDWEAKFTRFAQGFGSSFKPQSLQSLVLR